MEPRSVVDCVQIFSVCTIGRRLLSKFLRIKNCQDPLIFPIFRGGAFGKCIGRRDTPAIWDRSRISGLKLQSLRGI